MKNLMFNQYKNTISNRIYKKNYYNSTSIYKMKCFEK